MATEITKHIIRRALIEAHDVQREKAIVPPLAPMSSGGGFNAFIFFNIESVDGLGHSLMGYGPVGKPIDTISFYRHSDKVVAPAKVASLYKPEPFESIVAASGWITHGDNGVFWNEHMNCCLAIEFDEKAYKGVKAFAEQIKKDPGEYNLIKRNCVHIVLEALAAGSISLDTCKGRELDPVIPRTVFDDVCDVIGASKFGMWAYWFPITKPPENGFQARELIVDDPNL